MFRSPSVAEWGLFTIFCVVIYGWLAWELWRVRKKYREQTQHERKAKDT